MSVCPSIDVPEIAVTSPPEIVYVYASVPTVAAAAAAWTFRPTAIESA